MWPDIAATLTELSARSIAQAVQAHCPDLRYPGLTSSEIVIGGGGRHNPYLLGRISANLTGAAPAVTTHEDHGIDSDAKEALVFALLAYLALRHIPASVPQCTGATHAAFLGKICPGKNWNQILRM